MTVKELIEKLKQFDENAKVEIAYNDEYTEEVEEVWQTKPYKFNPNPVVIIQNY